MIDRKMLVLALSLFLGSPALAQDPPAGEGRDGLAQGVPWHHTPRGAGSVDPLPPPPPPPPPTGEAGAEDLEATLARFVLDYAERRVQKIDEDVLALVGASEAPAVVDLRDRVKELEKQLRRARSTCPEAYADFVRKVLPALEEAERRAGALSKTLGLLAEATRTTQVYAESGRALTLESDSLSDAARALVRPQLDAARDALKGAREAIAALDLERARAASTRVERALEGARSIIRNARRGSGPYVQ